MVRIEGICEPYDACPRYIQKVRNSTGTWISTNSSQAKIYKIFSAVFLPAKTGPEGIEVKL